MKFIVNDDGHIDVNLDNLRFKIGIDGGGATLKPGIEVEIDDNTLKSIETVAIDKIRKSMEDYQPTISMRCVKPIQYSWSKELASQFVFDRIHDAYTEWNKEDLVQLIMEMQGLGESRQVSDLANVMFESCDDPELKSAIDFLLLVEFAESEHNKG